MKIGQDGVFAFVTQGFGNRMRAIASAVILASLNNTRATIIWEPSEECNIHFHEIFDIHQQLPFTLLTIHTALETLKNIKSYHFERIHTNTILSNDNIDTVNALVVEGGHEYKDPRITVSEFITQKHNVYNSLQFTPQITSIANQLETKNPSLLIGIHLRVYIDQFDQFDKDDVYEFQKNTAIQNTMNTIQTIHNNNKNLMFFLACNHLPSKQTLIQKCNELNIKTICFDQSNTSQILSNRNIKDSMIQSIAEFITLSKCLFIIGTYKSSFSDEATAFNKQLSMKICPNPIPFNEPYHCYGLENIHNKNILHPNQSLLTLLQEQKNDLSNH